MRKNETELIKSRENKIFTAYGYKFKQQLLQIVLNSKGINKYSLESVPFKEKITELLEKLVFENGLTKNEILQGIKENKFKLLN